MTAPPIPFAYEGQGVFRALPRFVGLCAEHYGQGEVVNLAPQEERSEVSHRHEFVWLKEAWQTLPDHIAADYPSAEHLRKRALIATGWCHVRDYPCPSRKEAVRLAAALNAEVDEYTVVIVAEDVVRVCRAKSQARNKMKAADFQRSKQDILEWVSALLGADPEQLSRAGQEPGGRQQRRPVAA